MASALLIHTGIKAHEEYYHRGRADSARGILHAAFSQKITHVGKQESYSLSAYLQEIRRIALLSASEERELAERVSRGLQEQTRLVPDTHVIAEGEEAFHRLVKANLRLVVRIARAYAGRGMDLMDLIQEGNLALLYAAQG